MKRIALATLLALGATNAAAFSPPCVGIETFMIVCCPKPCPVIDFIRVAKHKIETAMQRAKLALHTEEADQHADHVRIMGPVGPRPTVMNPSVCPEPDPVLEGPSANGYGEVTTRTGETKEVRPEFILADAPAEEQRDAGAYTEWTRQQAVADAEQMLPRLAAATDSCAELIAKLSGAVGAAADIRAISRAAAELRTAITICEQSTLAARAIITRIEGTELMTGVKTRKLNLQRQREALGY